MTQEKPRARFQTNAKPSGLNKKLPYRSQQTLLSEGELRFYRQGLKPVLGKRYLICPKVRLTDVLHVPAGLWDRSAGRRIRQRHVDFVLTKKSDLAIVAVIELDDASHLERERQAKDAYLADALHAAGIPLIRFPIYRRYEAKKIARIVRQSTERFAEGRA